MLKNTENIITDEQLKQLKEVEEIELSDFFIQLLRDSIVNTIKDKPFEETEFKLIQKNSETKSEIKGSNINIIKMFVEAFLVDKDFKNIVLNLSRLNFVYSENEIREIFKLS